MIKTVRFAQQIADSLDTVVEELLYITGPLLVGVFTTFVHPALGVAVSSGLVLTGTLLLMTSPVVSMVQQQADDRREQAKHKPPVEATAEAGSRWRRGLAMIGSQPGVVGPVLVAASVRMCIGALTLLIVAFTTEQHNLAAAAWVEAALAVGSVIGGLVYGARTWKVSSGTRLSLLALSMGLAVAAAGLSVNIVMLAVLVAVVGLFISPVLATAYLAADEAAPASARTQAGAWVNTGFNVGSSGGVAGLGLLVSSVPLALCFVISGAPAVLAAVTPVALRGRKTDISPEGPAASVATERV